MKHLRWSFVVCIAAAGATTLQGCKETRPARPDASAQRPAPPRGSELRVVAQAMLDLESEVQWPDGGVPWLASREQWMENVRRAATAQELAARLAELEMCLGASAFPESWQSARRPWLDALATPDARVLARSTTQLGAAVLDARMRPPWPGKKRAWLARFEAPR